MPKAALAVVQATKSEVLSGVPIHDIAERVATHLTSRDGVVRVSIRTMDAERNVALLSIDATQPAILKRLAGNGVVAVYQKVYERTVGEFTRKYGSDIADSAWSWAHLQRALARQTASP